MKILFPELLDDLHDYVNSPEYKKLILKDMETIGSCAKHPGFNMVNCPVCQVEAMQEAEGIVNKKIDEIESRILAGKEIIKTCKEQLKNLEKIMDDLVTLKRKMFK